MWIPEEPIGDFIPMNDLEFKLMDAHNGLITPPEFLESLRKYEVYLPIYDQRGISGFRDAQSTQPLLMENDSGQQALCLFTTPERAKPVVVNYPGYDGGLWVGVPWILETLGAGFHLLINPGWPVWLDLESETLRQSLH